MTRSTRFIINVFWNWLGVAAGLISGLLLSPYLIRKLGPDGYGVWALSFAVVEYYWLTDLGFRSATVKYVAHYWATEEPVKVREIVNTALLYATVIAAVLTTAVVALAPQLERLFQIAPAYSGTFPVLVMLITVNWAFGAVFNVLGAALEAVQRFDLSNRVSIVGTVVRTCGTFALLYSGYGLIAVGVMVVASQCVTYVLHFWNYRRVFSLHQISPRYASRAALRQMAGFGIHTFLMNVSMQLSSQSAPVLIGHYRPVAFVGYYSLPLRLLQYTVELVGRIGLVTNANAAELAAKNERHALEKLAIVPNRYCLVIFMPLAIVFWTYGDQLFRLWVGAAFALQAAPVLPILLVGSLIAIVGQFSSSMLLQGLGRHQAYARGLLAEAIVAIVLLMAVIPRYGITGAAWVTTGAMILNRALFVSWLTSRVVGVPVQRYLHEIYTRPVAVMIPVLMLARWVRNGIVPGDTWLQLVSVGIGVALAYYGMAAIFCLTLTERAMLLEWASRLRGNRREAVSAQN